jgi:hypothetical protein
MVAQTVASRDGCRCEIVHIGQVVICTDHAVAAQYAPMAISFRATPLRDHQMELIRDIRWN